MKAVWFKLAGALLLASAAWEFSIVAAALAYAAIELACRMAAARRDGVPTLSRLPRYVRFFADFAWELTVSNLVLARDVLTPKDYHHVTFVRVPVGDLSGRQKTLLAQRITLTPGTLACGLDEDEEHIIVHVMYPGPGDQRRALRRPIDILKGEA